MGPVPDPPPQNSVSKTIDENGGELALGDEAWVNIPAGALDSALVITITRVLEPLNPPANYVSQGAAYSFTPHRYPFNLPVTIGITYDSEAADPSMVRLDDDADTSWEPVGSADCAEGTATCGSSTFSILSVTSFQALEEVYVSTGSQGTYAAGTKEDPLPGINGGIQAALAAGAPYPPVMVASGTYAELVEFVEGVSVQGGLDGEAWEYSSDPVSYTIIDLGPNYARATGITESTRIAGLVLVARDATVESTSSVALHVVDCAEGLRFVNCRFMAGKGADGSPGDSGGGGGSGMYGGDAGDGQNDAHFLGGTGGLGAYNRTEEKGGDGGLGWNAVGDAGGQGEPWWCGGLGGMGAGALYAFNGANGAWGVNGGNGTAGTNDQAGTIAGWSAVSAPYDATGGAPGCGGGGGGGGSHLQYRGTGGAGGGGGGGGGGPGHGGAGGGSSFAIYLWESSPVFVNCEFFAGDGGHGGNGGNGGNWGPGGEGGITHWSPTSWEYYRGGYGGAGGRGGFGGSGGGGAGGHSFCVYRFGSACQNADFSACNTWDFHPGPVGRGGAGGQASDGSSEGVQAPRGDDGMSGRIGPE